MFADQIVWLVPSGLIPELLKKTAEMQDGPIAMMYTVTFNGNGYTDGPVPKDGEKHKRRDTVCVLLFKAEIYDCIPLIRRCSVFFTANGITPCSGRIGVQEWLQPLLV